MAEAAAAAFAAASHLPVEPATAGDCAIREISKIAKLAEGGDSKAQVKLGLMYWEAER